MPAFASQASNNAASPTTPTPTPAPSTLRTAPDTGPSVSAEGSPEDVVGASLSLPGVLDAVVELGGVEEASGSSDSDDCATARAQTVAISA